MNEPCSLSGLSGVNTIPYEEDFYAAVRAARGAGDPEISWAKDRVGERCPVVTVRVDKIDFIFDSSGDFGWLFLCIAREPRDLIVGSETIIRAYREIGADKGVWETAIEQGEDRGSVSASSAATAWAARILPDLFAELHDAGYAAVRSRLERGRAEQSQAWDNRKSVTSEDLDDFDRRRARRARRGD